MHIQGFRRANGQIGIRNRLLILPSVLCSSSTCAQIANAIPDAVSIANQAGCAQVGDDLIQTKRTLQGFGKNPNVGGVLIVGLGCEGVSPKSLANEITKSDKAVEHLVIQQIGGTSNTIEQGIKEANTIMNEIAIVKDDASLEEISIGVIVDDNVESDKKKLILHAISQISNLVEVVIIQEDYKSFFDDPYLLDYGVPIQKKGTHYTPSKLGKIALMTGMVASGAQLLLHFTEDGDPASSSISPVIKCCVNKDIAQIFADHIDLDVSEQLDKGNTTMLTDQILEIIVDTINGEGTKSELLGLNDFAIHRILPSF
ncbi:UxaA family hydrolase [Gracilibacillus sp. D59]|uniref:UxaA family hydrolase n=1 Tax=Gracilibacillus sp. D59 TaxID=3457434 RepID=UPI003FCC99D1